MNSIGSIDQDRGQLVCFIWMKRWSSLSWSPTRCSCWQFVVMDDLKSVGSVGSSVSLNFQTDRRQKPGRRAPEAVALSPLEET